MPVYKVKIPAHVYISIQADTPVLAKELAEALADDSMVSLPFGFDINIGLHPGQMYLVENAIVDGILPETTDPHTRARPSFKEYMKMCFSDNNDEPDE